MRGRLSKKHPEWDAIRDREKSSGLPAEILAETDGEVYKTIYDEPMPEKQKKATYFPKKPLGKHARRWAITGITLLCLAVFVGSGLLYVFWNVIFDKSQNSDLGAYYGYFGYAPDTESEDSVYIDYTEHLAAYSDELNAAAAQSATAEQKALAAYILYRTACLANSTAPMSAKYTTGGGSATGDLDLAGTLMSVGATMNLTSTYYHLSENFDVAPSSIAEGQSRAVYTANEEYTQIPAGGVTASDSSIQAIGQLLLGAMLPFARRTVITPEKRVTWNGDQQSSVITPTGVTGDFSAGKSSFSVLEGEQLAASRADERQYAADWYDPYGFSSKDISDHVINLKTILADTVTVEKKTGTALTSDISGMKYEDYYEVTFEVDTVTGRGTADSATYYAEQMYLAHAPTSFLNLLSDYKLYYTKLKVTMTVFENGYMRTWGTDETWAMSGGVDLVSASAVVTTNNFSTEAYCYDKETVLQGFVNRWFADDCSDQNARIASSSLPFATALTAYTRQPYGTYR